MTARALAVRSCLLAWLLGAAGCQEERPLTWRYELPAGAGPSVIVIARIREGGCNDGDPIVYEARPRDASRPTIPPPILEPDRTYCFDVIAEDPSVGCAVVARSTVAIVPGTAEPTLEVVNVLDPAHPRLPTCDAPDACTPEVGCLRCDPEDEVACAGPPRCCPLVFECADPLTLVEGTCDEP